MITSHQCLNSDFSHIKVVILENNTAGKAVGMIINNKLQIIGHC